MNRRNFLSLAGLGAAASQSVAQEIAQRTEDSPLDFINQKQGLHPYRRTGAGKRPNIFVVTLVFWVRVRGTRWYAAADRSLAELADETAPSPVPTG